LFSASGLELEHSKLEVYHFSRRHGDENPPIDLGFAPHMGATPLRPRPYWRYLSFYFNRALNFREHVRFYSTKALTTVKSMVMLGNLVRGLLPMHKRLLYWSCIVPVAMYGFHLWFHRGSCNKALLKQLNTMQQRAAIWICGAFHTSPMLGVEVIAGLMPMH